MLVVIKFISSLILSTTGFLVISNLQEEEIKFNLKNIIGIFLLSIFTLVFTEIEYSGNKTMISFLIMLIIYKQIFQYSLSKSVIVVGIFMILMFIGDAITSLIFIPITSLETLRNDIMFMPISNILVSLIAYLISRIRIIREKVNTFIKEIDAKQHIKSIITVVLLIVVLTMIFGKLSDNFQFNRQYLTDLTILGIFAILIIFYIQEKNNYDKLNHEYDYLFEYVQTFEGWIEEEQINLHESKNQLIMLREMTTDKKVQKEIDKILKQRIQIETKWIEQLKDIPKGGLKGLLYYKLIVAKNNKITAVVDVGKSVKSSLSKIKGKDLKLLCRLVGIYIDNAIEAAQQCKRKKNLSIEIYKIKDKINIVITNSFDNVDNLTVEQIGIKGVTTKGKKRGMGTYLAKRFVKKSDKFEVENQIINQYYVQKIMIDI